MSLRRMGSRRPAVSVALLTVASLMAAILAQSSPGGPGLAAPVGGGSAEGADTQANPVAVGNGVYVGHSYKNDQMAKPLRETPNHAAKPRTEEEEEPRANGAPRLVPDGGLKNKAIEQAALASPQMPTSNLSFDGIPFPGVVCNCAPPDTTGEVGLTQYVQLVNEGMQVFSKSTGGSLMAPKSIASIWTGFGGVCENNGHGDPVVLYDQIANRWVVTQFAGSSIPTDECVAVSTTADATATYNRYGFHLGSNFFDYPHLSVWPDAYYMSMNVFNSAGSAFLGPQPFAFNRSAMLAGTAATFVTTGLLSFTDDAMLPADLDGSNMPPTGAPDPFIMGGEHTTQRIYRMHVDFATPANTTFTIAGTVTPPAFTVACPTTRACVPEPNGDRVDAIGDRVMFRAAYRRFADGHEALVGNQSVCVLGGGTCNAPTASDTVSVRWFEINNVTSGTPSIVQAATYQPDTTHRWMGSAAMDRGGNIAVCYSAASAAVVPGLRCAGRLASDPLNSLAQGETVMFAGIGSQTATVNRWGDYSDLTIDPVDDCTFWYTTEYYPAGSTAFNWRTRIVSFKFPACVPGPHGTAHFVVTQCPTSPALAGASVTIDGLVYGITDSSGVLDASLTPGTHNYSISKSGWTSAAGSTNITDGVTTPVAACLTSTATPPPTTPPPTTPPTSPPPTGTPGPTPTAGGPIAQLTASAATCAQFSGNSAASLSGLVYKATRSKITTVTPSAFRYWVRVSAVAGNNTVTVHQAITSGNFATVFGLSTGSAVYNTACTSGFSPTFSASSVNATNNDITVTFSAPAAGSYYVSVNFSTTSVKNKSVPSPTTVPYTFSTNGVTGSSASLTLHQ